MIGIDLDGLLVAGDGRAFLQPFEPAQDHGLHGQPLDRMNSCQDFNEEIMLAVVLFGAVREDRLQSPALHHCQRSERYDQENGYEDEQSADEAENKQEDTGKRNVEREQPGLPAFESTEFAYGFQSIDPDRGWLSLDLGVLSFQEARDGG